jgi:opacity protein-like surface antigen
MKHAHFRFVSAIGLVLATAASGAAAAQQTSETREPLPSGDVFQSLLADPKEPRFFASYLWDRSPHLASQVSSVGLGQTIGLMRSPNGRLQVSVAAGVFSQFSMRAASNDLVNTDYIIGLPVTYRSGTLSTRFRLYHQSSHLGDEFLLHTQTQRVDLTFQAAEALVSQEISNWRVYGGGEYIFQHQPADLKPVLLHGGLEYHQAGPLLRLGRLGEGRFVAGLDGKSFQDRKWRMGWSLMSGVEFEVPTATGGSGWRWSVLVQAYDGPAPFGQFYRQNVSSVGVGLAFTL